MNGNTYEVQATDVIERLSKELADMTRRAVIAEAARDSLIQAVNSEPMDQRDSDDV